MPRQTKLTQDEILDRLIQKIRTDGMQWISMRNAAAACGCSTQPIVSQFQTIQNLKDQLWKKADELQTEALMNIDPDSEEEILFQIGLNYVRFAQDEPQLFRLIFESGWARPAPLSEMISAAELEPVLLLFEEESGLNRSDTRILFTDLSMFLHGYASMIASGMFSLDETYLRESLELMFAALTEELKRKGASALLHNESE